MLPCNSSDSSDWLKICLYKYGACPSIKSRLKRIQSKSAIMSSSRLRTYSQFGDKQLITEFRFTKSCSKDIFDILLGTWWYLWTNCPEVILLFLKSQSPRQEFTTQNLHALLWCKLHRRTSSQLGTKLIFKKYLSSLVANLSTSMKLIPSTSTQIISKWFSFFCFLYF